MITRDNIDTATLDYYEGRDSGITDADYDAAFAHHFPDIEPLDRYRELKKNSEGGLNVRRILDYRRS